MSYTEEKLNKLEKEEGLLDTERQQFEKDKEAKLTTLTPGTPEYAVAQEDFKSKQKELDLRKKKINEEREKLENEIKGIASEEQSKEVQKQQKKIEEAQRSERLRNFGLLIIGALVLSALFLGIFSPDFLLKVKDVETARGLITFLLAIATIAIAIILAMYAVTGTYESKDDEEAFKTHFANAKEVLTALIGILGTIIGFYFGNTIEAAKKEAGKEPVLQVAPAHLSKPQLNPGDPLSFTSYVSGGKAPYHYSINFNPKIDISPEIKEKPLTTNYIVEEVKVPDTTKEGDYTLKLDIKDSSGKTATLDNPEKIRVKKKAP